MITPYGKLYDRLYSGSMVGKGCVLFALMPYVISKQYPASREHDAPMLVELNANLLALIFGATEEEVVRAIEFLCSPDPKSRSKAEEGKRLVREGEYLYRVVNGRYYRELADEERLAENARKYTKKWRARQMLKARHVPGAGEREYIAAFDRGASEEELEAILAKWLPKSAQAEGARVEEKDRVRAAGEKGEA
jgi:hypothetical protein